MIACAHKPEPEHMRGQASRELQAVMHRATAEQRLEVRRLLGPNSRWNEQACLIRDLHRARSGKISAGLLGQLWRLRRPNLSLPFDAIDPLPPRPPEPPVIGVPPHEKRGYIYFIASGGFIKIGFSNKVPTRMAGLQTASPHTLTLLHTMPGTIEEERALHRRFAADRHRGEWFRRSRHLSIFITRLQRKAEP